MALQTRSSLGGATSASSLSTGNSSSDSGSTSGSESDSGSEQASQEDGIDESLLRRDVWAEAAFNRLVETCPTLRAKKISTFERDSKSLVDGTLTYGEIMFEPFAMTFRKIRHLYGGLQKAGGKFVDLGSGSGKPIFAAALLHDWDELLGIEILDGLHALSLELLERWKSPEFQDSLLETVSSGISGEGNLEIYPQRGRSKVTFVKEDMTKIDWSDADFLFANSTCYNEPLMQKLAAASETMKPGSFAVTFTKCLPSGNWEVLESQTHTMTWGSATVYIHKKLYASSPAQFVGITPISVPPDQSASPKAKMLATVGPLATVDSVALDLRPSTRLWWNDEGSREGLRPWEKASTEGESEN